MHTMAIDRFEGEFAWLSNFHPSPVTFDGMTFPSVEHAYQAAKTLDLEIRKEFLTLTAGQAKRKGAKLELREDWESIKIVTMTMLVFNKFANDRELGDKLLATGDLELVEGNNWGDTFWGVCDGEGRNELGRILMAVRNAIGILRKPL